MHYSVSGQDKGNFIVRRFSDIDGKIIPFFDKYQIEGVKALDFFHHHDLNYMGEKSKQIETYFNTENSAQRTFDAIVSQVKTKD